MEGGRVSFSYMLAITCPAPLRAKNLLSPPLSDDFDIKSTSTKAQRSNLVIASTILLAGVRSKRRLTLIHFVKN